MVIQSCGRWSCRSCASCRVPKPPALARVPNCKVGGRYSERAAVPAYAWQHTRFDCRENRRFWNAQQCGCLGWCVGSDDLLHKIPRKTIFSFKHVSGPLVGGYNVCYRLSTPSPRGSWYLTSPVATPLATAARHSCEKLSFTLPWRMPAAISASRLRIAAGERSMGAEVSVVV
jgi:hypothetical protein